MKNQNPKYQNIFTQIKHFTRYFFFVRGLHVFSFISGCRWMGGWVGGWARVYKQSVLGVCTRIDIEKHGTVLMLP